MIDWYRASLLRELIIEDSQIYHQIFIDVLAAAINARTQPDSYNTSPQISQASDEIYTTPRPVSTLVTPIVEDLLWAALLAYRQSHQRQQLVLEEPLCLYARGRVAELTQRLKTIPEGETALDGHAGFHRDAENGSVFTRTGFPAVSENLAYLPQVKTATQVIEWGWDTSTSHRDAQLSNEWSHGCVVGPGPFFVALFAHR